MGIITKPNQYVAKCITMQRWERDWINSRNSINFSGLAQEVVIALMKKYDPIFYEQNKKFLEEKLTLRKDVIESVIDQNPHLIYSNI